MQVHLLIYLYNYKGARIPCMVYMDAMQSAADSMQALFPCNHTGYDNNKGQVLASVYYHYIHSSLQNSYMYITDVVG